MKTVFDFGMYDASDTLYYLENGYNVIAVEANPSLVDSARSRLAAYVNAGSLTLINRAISLDSNDVELVVCGADLGSSSVYSDSVASRSPLGTWRVPGITTEEIFERYGVPFYLKVDIEGADKLTVLALSSRTKPQYLSFEISEQLDQLIDHVAAIGFCKFKIVNQLTFRELSNQSNLRDRWARRIIRLLGYAEPQYIRWNGRYFKVGHSSGPAPWCSDGQWSSREDILKRWMSSRPLRNGNAWYDLHAA